MRTFPKTLRRRPDPVLSSAVPELAAEVDGLVGRFEPRVQRDVRRLIRMSPDLRMADLARVFPGAVFALATGYGTPAERRAAVSLIEAGAPLKSVARELGLPLWLRRLPPEAFRRQVPHLPCGEDFARRIANRMPSSIGQSAFWLDSVAFAARACHEDFALWLAEQPIFADDGDAERLFAVLAAYAWFSSAPLSRANRLIVVPWRAEIGFDTALCAAKSWLNRLRLVLQLLPGVISDTWLKNGRAGGYTFVALTEARQILEEAQAMQNCTDQYADRLARDRCRLFSVRRGASRLATVEIGPHPRETGILTVTQLKARHNMPAPLEIWQAAHVWLSMQEGLKRLPPMVAPERLLDNRGWAQLVMPYRQATDGAPWLPDHLTPVLMARLDADMADLARRGCVTSWLFT